jgi:hypothetical protein
LADAQRELVLDFLRRGAATGAVLDAPKDRQIAQGLLDYWKATLYTQRRSAQETAQTERDLSSIPLARLADFDEQNLAQLAAAAEEAVAKLAPQEQQAAQAMLLQLIQPRPDGTGFNTVPAQEEDLAALIRPASANTMIEGLVQAGALRRTGDADQQGRTLELASESLLRLWPRLATLIDQRRRFRESARLWDKHNRNSGELLTGAPLANGSYYHNLDPIEEAFLRESTQRHTSRWRWMATGAAMAALVAIALAVFAFLQWNEAAVLRDNALNLEQKAEDAQTAEATARKKAEEEKELAVAQRQAALRAQHEAESRRDELIQFFNQVLDEKVAPNVLPQALRDQYKARLRVLEGKQREQSALLRSEASVQPGVSVGLDTPGPSGGSVCCIVKDRAGQRFLLTARYVLDGKPGASVYRPGRVDDTSGLGSKVASLVAHSNPQQQKQVYGVLAQLLRDVDAKNNVPGFCAIPGVAQSVQVNQEVVLVGRGSGIVQGKITQIKENGELLATLIAKPGDGGGPVMTKSGELIGMLWVGITGKDQCIVIPIQRLFRELNVALLP